MRRSFDEYVFALADTAAAQGTCALRRVGAVLVRDRKVVMPCFNGARDGKPHCDHTIYARPEDDPGLEPCEDGYRCARSAHAEENVIDFSREHGIQLGGGVMYVTCRPCARCTPKIVLAGICEVVIRAGQDTKRVRAELGASGVRLREVSLADVARNA